MIGGWPNSLRVALKRALVNKFRSSQPLHPRLPVRGCTGEGLMAALRTTPHLRGAQTLQHGGHRTGQNL